MGYGPYQIAQSPDMKLAYVTNFVNDYISVVDLEAKQEIATITTGAWPLDIAVTADGKFAYVTHEYGGLSIIDLTLQQKVGGWSTGNPTYGVALSSGLSSVVHSQTPTDHTTPAYDPATRTYTRHYPDGMSVHFDPNGTHDYTLHPDGRKTLYTYNPDGTVASMGIVAPGESTPRWVWAYSYANGELSTITDPAGRITSFTINEHGQLSQISGPDGATRKYTYDQNSLLTNFTDENGAVTGYTYDGYGRIRRVTEPARPVYDPTTDQTNVIQETRVFTPSDTGYQLINDSPVGSPVNPAPAVPTSEELVDRVKNGRGESSGHTNEWGSWLDETDGEGRTTYYERDAANNLIRQDNADGTCASFIYDKNGNKLSETRSTPAQCTATKGASGRQVFTNPAQTSTYTYEERFNQVKTETDPLGHTKIYFYDYELDLGEAGKLIRIEYPPVANEAGITVTPQVGYTYNTFGLKATETDARGIVTQYQYTQGTPDEAFGQANARFAPGVTPAPGLLTAVVRDAGGLNDATTYSDIDGAGNPQTVIAPGGATMRFTYDAWGRLLTETDALGIVTKYEYDARGNLVRKIVDYTADASGRNVVTEATYNPHDQLTSEFTYADGLAVGHSDTLDINRKLALRRDGLGRRTVYRYDSADQLINVIDPTSAVITLTYTADGQVETTTDAEGSVTRIEYDGFRRPVAKTVDFGGLNLVTSYEYDLNDNLEAVTDPAGVVTCYEFDAHNRQVAEHRDCRGLNLITTYVYDLNGNVVSVTDPRGIVTYSEYDALNRLTLTRQDNGGLNLETRFTYDAAGNLATTTDERGVVTGYTYDARNQLTRSCEDALGLNLCTTYTYDRLGNRLTTTDPKGVTTRTEQNAFGQMMQEVADAGGLNATTRHEYDNALNLVRLVDANGNATQYAYTPRNQVAAETYADGATVQYGYDRRGKLRERTAQDGVTTTHSYDGAGRLTEKAFATGGSQTFAYDPAGRLTQAGQTLSGHASQLTFDYNALGDVTHTTQALDGRLGQSGIPTTIPTASRLSPILRVQCARTRLTPWAGWTPSSKATAPSSPTTPTPTCKATSASPIPTAYRRAPTTILCAGRRVSRRPGRRQSWLTIATAMTLRATARRCSAPTRPASRRMCTPTMTCTSSSRSGMGRMQ